MDDYWGFSSSSSDDDDRPISSFRKDTDFYRQFQNGDYGGNWPIHLLDVNCMHRNGYADHSIHTNGNASMTNGHTSMADISQIPAINNSQILSPSAIANSTQDERMVLLDVGNGKFQLFPVITKEKLIPPKLSPGNKSKISVSIPPKVEPMEELDIPYQPPKNIPLEIIDFINMPTDPRQIKRDDYGDEDAENQGLPLPLFWMELRLQMALDRNRERNSSLNGSFKRSNSYVREKELAKTNRLNMTAPKRTDPRLERLFNGPNKIASPPKAMNQTQPIASSSFFEPDNAENVSSDSSSFSSSPSESFGSLPSAGEEILNFSSVNSNSKPKNMSLDSLSDSETDFSFSAFSKRKRAKKIGQTTKRTKSSVNEKVEPIKIDLKSKRVTPAKKTDLFGTPPSMDKASILNALTDETKDETEKISANVPAKTVKSAKKPKKPQFKLNLKKPGKASKKSTRVEIPTATTPIEEAVTVETQSIADVTLLNDDMDLESLPELNLSITSDKSPSSSLGSIEQRLAEMTSPVKTAAEVRAEQEAMEKNKLTYVLSADAQQNGQETIEPIIVAAADSSLNGTNVSPQTIETISIATASIQIVNGDKNVQVQDTLSILDDEPSDNVINTENNPNEHQNNAVIIPSIENLVQTLDASNQVQPNVDKNTEDSPNMSFELPDIAANAEIFVSNENINLDEYSKILDSLPLESIMAIDQELNPTNSDVAQPKKAERAKIIIDEFPVNGNKIQSNDDISDDDFEIDQACDINELILPNSTADQNDIEQFETSCSLCEYTANKGWKQLTKHYVRKHPGKPISISRLAKGFNVQTLIESTPIVPKITKGLGGTMIKSLCYICNKGYNMCSEKWLAHFIAHTGEFEFRCNKCHKEIMENLHKECNSHDNERINGPHAFVDNVLYGYVCGLSKCNYVQLSKKNMVAHLENEHQLITGDDDDNIMEIILLKIEQPIEINEDNKKSASLVEAKQRVANYDRTKYIDAVEITDDESDIECVGNKIEFASIDLTLTDDED